MALVRARWPDGIQRRAGRVPSKNEQATFCVQPSIRNNRMSLASAVRANRLFGSGVAIAANSLTEWRRHVGSPAQVIAA